MWVLGWIQNIGPIPFLVILFIMVIVFGSQLPKLARSVGATFVEFKKGLRGGLDDAKKLEDDIKKEKDRIADSLKE